MLNPSKIQRTINKYIAIQKEVTVSGEFYNTFERILHAFHRAHFAFFKKKLH